MVFSAALAADVALALMKGCAESIPLVDGLCAGFFWSILSKAYGCYGVSLRGASGAHAIALAHDRHNRYHLFDANYFHIMMDSESAFRSYVTRYLDKTGYKTTYNTRCGIVGIRPPHQ